MAKHKLEVKLNISGYVHGIIEELHNQYPNKERSGIARIEKQANGYEMTDIRFPKQSNHWAETEIKDWWLSELLEEIFNETPEQLGERKCWIHSHHNMWVFRSGTDEAAKRSFNDGNMDYRRSVVTAYDKKGVTYKCALNIFNPVNQEFNIPVSYDEFDIAEYMQMVGQDYTEYNKIKTWLDEQLEIAITNLTENYEPSPQDIMTMISIFNVPGSEEDIAIIKKLLLKDFESRIEARIETLEENYNEELMELNAIFWINYFEDKLKELEDNIIAPAYSYLWRPEKAIPLFKEDIKYNNNTAKPFTWLWWWTHDIN